MQASPTLCSREYRTALEPQSCASLLLSKPTTRIPQIISAICKTLQQPYAAFLCNEGQICTPKGSCTIITWKDMSKAGPAQHMCCIRKIVVLAEAITALGRVSHCDQWLTCRTINTSLILKDRKMTHISQLLFVHKCRRAQLVALQ